MYMLKMKDILLELRSNDDEHRKNMKNGFWGNVGAGVLPISMSTQRFLICHRSAHVQEPNTFNVWGGAIDPGEDPKETVEREFLEESGYNKKFKLIPAYTFRAPNGHFTYYNFIGILKNEFEPNLDWESQGYKWLTYDELKMLNNKHFGLATLLRESSSLIQSILYKLDSGEYKI